MNGDTIRYKLLHLDGIASESTSDLLHKMLPVTDDKPPLSYGKYLVGQLVRPFRETSTPLGCSMFSWCRGSAKPLLSLSANLSRMSVSPGCEFKIEWFGWTLKNGGRLFYTCGFEFDPNNDDSYSDYELASITMNKDRVDQMREIFEKILVYNSLKTDQFAALLCITTRDATLSEEKFAEAVDLLTDS